MMQPPTNMVPPHMAPPQYQQQPPQQTSQHWMPQQPQQPQQPPYQVPPPQQPSAAGYYYSQLKAPAASVPPQHPQLYMAAPTAPTQAQQSPDDGIRSLWIGDLHYWMDEQYLYGCFATTGEVVNVKVIRNKQSGASEGYGFIEFVSHAAAERNLQTYNGSLMPSTEQPFRLNWASMGAGERRDDTLEYTIFVGDLAADVTDYMLQETFRANYPSVKGAKVVADRITGRTKGYGFVRFNDEGEQVRAMTEMNGKFCSTRPMRIGPAANKQKVDGQTKGSIPGQEGSPWRVGEDLRSVELLTARRFLCAASYQTPQGTPNEDDPTNTTIFVGNLDSNITDDHLSQVFGQYGQLLHVKIPVGKRCGFVQFVDRSCAEEALRMLNGTQLGGQSIRLSWGRSVSNKQVDPNQWSGGYYGYAPGYETYGYAPAAQDPNMYYAGYPGYGNYPPPQQQQMQQPQVIYEGVRRNRQRLLHVARVLSRSC
ncbi:Polyadenylate-binding protein rbp45 [Orobanche minor]